MATMGLEDVADIVWSQCIDAKPDEKALIASDASGERLEIGEALLKTGKQICKCRLMKMKPTGMPGTEPTPEVAKAMLKADIVIAPTKNSLTHTMAADNAAKQGARVTTMPGITKDIFLRTIPLDYNGIDAVNTKLKEILLNSRKLRVTTAAGTDIAMEIVEGRTIVNGNGIAMKGKIVNLPCGEVYFAPREAKSNGTVVFDLSALNKKLAKPFRVEVKDGHAVSCEHRELWKILTAAENGTNLAELGIGTNPKAKVTGNILEDEKVRGTAHIAFGTNAPFGGTVQTSVHLDSIFSKPTIEADGKTIISEGRFLF